jgi:hypothetical protein
VGRDQHRGATRLGVVDDVLGGLDPERVDTVERLVEQQHTRLVERGEHYREPPPHPVAEATGDPVCGVAELEPLQQLLRSRLPALHPAQPGGELEVLPRGRPRHEAAHVGAVAGRALDGERVDPDVDTVDENDALTGRDHPRQHAHRGRLAGAVAAQQGGRPAAVRRDVDAAHGLDRPEANPQATDPDPLVGVGGLILHPSILPDRARRRR